MFKHLNKYTINLCKNIMLNSIITTEKIKTFLIEIILPKSFAALTFIIIIPNIPIAQKNHHISYHFQ